MPPLWRIDYWVLYQRFIMKVLVNRLRLDDETCTTLNFEREVILMAKLAVVVVVVNTSTGSDEARVNDALKMAFELDLVSKTIC